MRPQVILSLFAWCVRARAHVAGEAHGEQRAAHEGSTLRMEFSRHRQPIQHNVLIMAAAFTTPSGIRQA